MVFVGKNMKGQGGLFFPFPIRRISLQWKLSKACALIKNGSRLKQTKPGGKGENIFEHIKKLKKVKSNPSSIGKGEDGVGTKPQYFSRCSKSALEFYLFPSPRVIQFSIQSSRIFPQILVPLLTVPKSLSLSLSVKVGKSILPSLHKFSRTVQILHGSHRP